MAWWSPVPDAQSDRFSYEEEQRARREKLDDRLISINQKVRNLLEKRSALLKQSETDSVYRLSAQGKISKIEDKIKRLLTKGEMLKVSGRYKYPLGDRIFDALLTVLFPIPTIRKHIENKQQSREKAEKEFTELC